MWMGWGVPQQTCHITGDMAKINYLSLISHA
jgi:hypothetical protein